MKRLVTAVLAAALFAAPVQAQTNFSTLLTFTSGPIYTPFVVSTGGVFDIFSSFRANDPTIWLFGGAVSGAPVGGAMIFGNDDWAGNCCGNVMPAANLPSAYAGMSGLDSGFRVNLAAGAYTIASCTWLCTEAEARAGTDVTGGSNTLNIWSANGVATPGVSVPEPGALLLVVTGALALLAIRRREGIA